MTPPPGSEPGSLDPSRQHEMAEFPEMNPGPVFRMDQSGRVLLANRAARELFGEGKVVGNTWDALFPDMGRGAWEHLLQEGGTCQHETEAGERFLVFTVAHRVGSDFVFAYGADVSQLKLAEKVLAEQTEKLAEMARFPDMNPGPVCRLNREGIVLLANTAARELFRRESLVGSSWLDLCPGMSEQLWSGICGEEGETAHEALVDGKHLLFTHRPVIGGEDVFVYGADVSAQKHAEIGMRQSEKMATLGTLAAGVAHELNNPAAAAQRAAEQLQVAFSELQKAQAELGRFTLGGEEREVLVELDGRAREQASCPCDLDPMEKSDREAEVEEWLEDRGVENSWDLAPHLVELEQDGPSLEGLAARLPPEAVGPVVGWFARVYPVYRLLDEIRHGAGRISEIVSALKSYSYVGQAPVQAVDVNEGIRNTLVILRNKLKQGITVEQDLAPDLPRLQAFGSELNQVWTNLIDNAADAMEGKGRLIIRSSATDGSIVVEVEDDGAGIPRDVQSRIFDPFFTTKPPGRGTGLGLNTSYKIVVRRHGGAIDVDSRPGRTVFSVKLPVQHPPELEKESVIDIAEATPGDAPGLAEEI